MERTIKLEITVTDHNALSEEDALIAFLSGLRQTMPKESLACIDKAKTSSSMQLNRPALRELTPSLFDALDDAASQVQAGLRKDGYQVEVEVNGKRVGKKVAA